MSNRIATMGVLLLASSLSNVASAQVATRRDSAGIRIVEVAASRLGALPTWRLEGPSVRIEASMGGVEYEFNRAGSPWQLSDGRIVVANEQVELRFFDATGKYLTTVARRGRGPGEYEQLFRLFRVAGDTLLAWDVPTQRIDVRDPNGRLVRYFNIPNTLTFAGLGGQGAVYIEYRRPDMQKLGAQQDTLVLRKMRSDSTAGDVVARLPGSWTNVMSLGGRGSGWRDVALSGSPMLAGGTHGAVFVHGDEFAAYWFGDAGQLTAISRVRLPRVRVTDADRRGHEQWLSDLLARNRQVRAEGTRPPDIYATHVPQVSRVTVDSEGRAWLQRWARYGSPTAEWVVLDRFGAPMARIVMPATFLPNDIGSDYVLGIMLDSDGVQSIHKYGIVRPALPRF